MKVENLTDRAIDHARRSFVSVRGEQTIAEALEQMRGRLPEGRVVYFYAVDGDGRLTGVVPTRRLLLKSPETRISDIQISPVISLPETATVLDACDFFIMHRLLALPIVDGENRLVGVIDVELYAEEMSDLADTAARQESDDLFQLIGVRLAEVRRASVPQVFGRRFPWLLCNVAGGLAAAILAGFFQHVLDRVVLLALFIPVVLALAESVSIQSLTLTLQAQHGKDRLSLGGFLKIFAKEIPVGLLLGLACGSLVAAAEWAWKGDIRVGLCLLVSIFFSVTAATLFGLSVPSAVRSVRGDPRIASGPITLALTDLTTLGIYLGLAAWMLR